jgi:hypothetical protein
VPPAGADVVAGWVVELPLEPAGAEAGAEVAAGAELAAGAEVAAGTLAEAGAEAPVVELALQPAASARTASAGPKVSKRRALADELFNQASQ